MNVVQMAELHRDFSNPGLGMSILDLHLCTTRLSAAFEDTDIQQVSVHYVTHLP